MLLPRRRKGRARILPWNWLRPQPLAVRVLRYSDAAMVVVLVANGALGATSGRHREVEHVKCQVCELAMYEAIKLGGGLGRRQKDVLEDAVDALCSVRSESGRWLTKLDLEQDGETVKITQHASPGVCRNECWTVQRACSKSLRGREGYLVELMLKGFDVSELKTHFCGNLCAVPPKPFRHVRKDEVFMHDNSSELDDDTILGETLAALLKKRLLGLATKVNDTVDHSMDDTTSGASVTSTSSAPSGTSPAKDDATLIPTRSGQSKVSDSSSPQNIAASRGEKTVHSETAPSEEQVTLSLPGLVFDRKQEIEHVKCQVCRLAVNEARRHVEATELHGNADALADIVEALCSVKRQEGRWLRTLDLEQDGESIKVVRRDTIGECRSECLTVQRACSKSLHGQEEKLREMLSDGFGVASMHETVCHMACKKRPSALVGPRVDEMFVAEGNESQTTLLDILTELLAQRQETSRPESKEDETLTTVHPPKQISELQEMAAVDNALRTGVDGSAMTELLADGVSVPSEERPQKSVDVLWHALVFSLFPLGAAGHALQGWSLLLAIVIFCIVCVGFNVAVWSTVGNARDGRSHYTRSPPAPNRGEPSRFSRQVPPSFAVSAVDRFANRDIVSRGCIADDASDLRHQGSASRRVDAGSGCSHVCRVGVPRGDLLATAVELTALLAAQEERVRNLTRNSASSAISVRALEGAATARCLAQELCDDLAAAGEVDESGLGGQTVDDVAAVPNVSAGKRRCAFRDAPAPQCA
eukprot:TRINITY_DN46279_c0_g1_i1.p1 TRINITY_DN46279_c0_g1~~TRINITY_DN46279_c0_g1_i1.p1  ORF type:complete len:761 (+),score=106.23 TRINITY_DN46279_c0_g1_i1:140-2422(+)